MTTHSTPPDFGDSNFPRPLPFAPISATISLRDMIGAINAPVPVGKPPLPISSADARTRALIQLLCRPQGCSRQSVDALVMRRINLGRMMKPYGMTVWATVTLEYGARYAATMNGSRPACFAGEVAWVI